MVCDDQPPPRGEGGGGGVGPVVSRMATQEKELAEEEKTMFDWCKEGRRDKLESFLDLTPDSINTKDSQVSSPYPTLPLSSRC